MARIALYYARVSKWTEHPASTGSAIPTILVLNHCAGRLRGLMDSNQPQLKHSPGATGCGSKHTLALSFLVSTKFTDGVIIV
jgi:hypothetical protein